MDLAVDYRDALTEFVRERVEFVVVGRHAVAFYGASQAPTVLELLVRGSAENLRRVRDALERFGAPKSVVEAIPTLGPRQVAYFGRHPIRIDLVRSIGGVDAERVFSRAVRANLDGTPIDVMGLDDLIAATRARNHPHDEPDLVLLEGLRSR